MLTLSASQLKTSLLSSIGLAVISLICFVLPAEFGIDPTGIGRLLGVHSMSQPQVQALSIESHQAQEDLAEFVLAPFESIEYKYVLAQNQSLTFSWRTEADVEFDLHSEAQGTDPEDAVTFAKGAGRAQHGTYVAPFDGVHGWFWENRGTSEVTVRLKTTTYADAAIVYDASGSRRRELQ